MRNILLIEDDPFLCEMYSSKFKETDFNLLIVKDAKEALKVIKKNKLDLILLDIILPGMDGFELLKKIKKDKSISDIPVIFLTNLSQKEDLEKGLKLGAQDYIIKAYNTPTEVVAKVKSFFDHEKISSNNKKTS